MRFHVHLYNMNKVGEVGEFVFFLNISFNCVLHIQHMSHVNKAITGCVIFI